MQAPAKIRYLLFTGIIFQVLFMSHLSAQSLTHCNCGTDSTGKRLYGFCDSLRTKVIIPCQYDSTFAFSNGMARVMRAGKTGYTDQSGKLVIPVQFERAGDFNDGLAFVKKDGKCYYINKTGANPFKSFFFCPSSPAIANASEPVVRMLRSQETEAYKMARFSEGMAIVADSAAKKTGFINLKGQPVIPATFIFAQPFSEGISFVRTSPAEAVKAINKKGEILFSLTENQLPLPDGFKNGFARIMEKPGAGSRNPNVYNYVDRAGKLLLPAAVRLAESFHGNFAVITESNGEMALINRKGQRAFPDTYHYLELSPIKGTYYYNREKGRGYGLVDSAGTIRTKVGYEYFTRLNDSVLLCKEWGTSLYNLLSIHSGALLEYSIFTNFSWRMSGKKPILSLTGTTLFNETELLEFNPATGKFLKDGKEWPEKDNYYLAINSKNSGKTAEPGIFSYQNPHFSLKFSRGMELFRDSTDGQVYRNSTFYFAIRRIRFAGSPGEYLDKRAEQLKAQGKYAQIERTRVSLGNTDAISLMAVEQKQAGSHPAVLFYIPVDRQFADPGKDFIYLLSGNYFLADESVTRDYWLSILQSFTLK
ncbi:MAG: WG repeat-containing protein [Sphingobacteriales bacterium]|nr:WG repeat-containing protein [Sphingobacteriales bacterium]